MSYELSPDLVSKISGYQTAVTELQTRRIDIANTAFDMLVEHYRDGIDSPLLPAIAMFGAGIAPNGPPEQIYDFQKEIDRVGGLSGLNDTPRLALRTLNGRVLADQIGLLAPQTNVRFLPIHQDNASFGVQAMVETFWTRGTLPFYNKYSDEDGSTELLPTKETASRTRNTLSMGDTALYEPSHVGVIVFEASELSEHLSPVIADDITYPQVQGYLALLRSSYHNYVRQN